MSGKAKVRAVGLAFGLGGDGLICWSWHEVQARGEFSMKMAFLGPLLIAMALHLMVEAPDLPVTKPSLLGWAFYALGGLGGLAYVEFLRTGRVPLIG